MEKVLYEDRKVIITNRKVTFARKSVHLATIRAIDIRQIREPSNMYKTLAYGFAWGLFCVLLDFTPIPTVFLFIAAVAGMWWLISRVWPYVVVADTQNSEEIVFSTPNRKYAEKIAHILSDALGVELLRKAKP